MGNGRPFLYVAPWVPPKVSGARLISVTYYDPYIKALAAHMRKQAK